MTHKAETILAALETRLSDLETTGANISRARAWPVSSVPALSIMMGQDILSEELSLGVIKRILTVDIVAYVNTTGVLETTLNLIKTEVFAAIMADSTLSGTASYAEIVGDDEPTIEAEQEQPTARMTMQWQIHYRHSATSTEV